MYLNDTFTGSAGTSITAHTPQTGLGWLIYNDSSAACLTNANRLRSNVNGIVSYFRASSPASADCNIEGDVYVASVPGSLYTGLFLRAPAYGNHGYAFYYDTLTSGGAWKLKNGSATELGSFTQTLTPGQTYHIKLTAVGSTINCIIDGVTQISVSDTSHTARGASGVMFYGLVDDSSGFHLDNVTGTSTGAYTANNLVADGDSITQGTGTNTLPWPTQIGTLLGATWTVSNVAVSGETLADMQADAMNDVDNLFSVEFSRNVMVIFGGTNDIFFNADADDTAATTIGRMNTYLSSRVGSFWSSAGNDLIVVTLLPRIVTSGTLPVPQQTHFNSRRSAFDADLIANFLSKGATRCADVGGDATLSDPTNVTYYQGDGVHPNNTGAGIIAADIYSLFPSGPVPPPQNYPGMQTIKVDTAATSTNLVPGVAGQTIRIYGVHLTNTSAVGMTLGDGATALTGVITAQAGLPWAPPVRRSGHPLWTLTAGNSFVLTLNSGVQTSGYVQFTQFQDGL